MEFKTKMGVTIGLFGTCGVSKWRDKFIMDYEHLGINYFNPNVSNWKPELAEIEAEHLAHDEIILFPVTNETYGTGSLSEVGFSILNAIKLDDRRSFVIMIDKTLVPELDNEVARKESLRARALVMEHLKKLRLSNLYVVDNLNDMFDISVELYNVATIIEPLKKFNTYKV